MNVVEELTVEEYRAKYGAAEPGKRSRKKPRSGERLPPGEGDRLDALGRLAAAGYMRTVCINSPAGERHYLIDDRTGERTPERATYRAAIDAALAMLKEGQQA